MNKKRILLITVSLAILTTIVAYFYMSGIEEKAIQEAQIEKIEIVTVVESVPAHVQLTEEMLEIKEVPKEFLSPSVVTTLDDAIGAVTKSELIAGEPILTERLVSNETESRLSYRIPEQMRAMTIPIDEIRGVASYVSAGDYVDLLISYIEEKVEEGAEGEEEKVSITTVYTQMQGIEILATGAYGQESIPESYTLLVSPEQAEVVAYAIEKGSIYLSLRNPSDAEKENLEGYGDDNFDSWEER